MIKDSRELYFEWLCDNILDTDHRIAGYDLLLRHLHNREFTWSIPMDENRANDGLNLRYIFRRRYGYNLNNIDPSCSILEMMVALARRVEDTIMTDDVYGDRTYMWFWSMIESLELYMFDDSKYAYHEDEIDERLDMFLYRTYDRYGHGGLFTVEHPRRDMRDVEIWLQLMWWLKERGD